jgi:hypothetical protein
MLMITELLTPTPGPLWRLVKQAGTDDNLTRQGGAMAVSSPSGMPYSRCQSGGSDSACARDRSWRGWLCHPVHVDDFKPEADDPLYKPGEGSLIGQLGAEGGRLRARGDLAVVELCAQRSAGLAAEGDLERV